MGIVIAAKVKRAVVDGLRVRSTKRVLEHQSSVPVLFWYRGIDRFVCDQIADGRRLNEEALKI